MYHPTKIVRQYLNHVNYYQRIVDLLPVPGIEMVELPKLRWKEHMDWTESHAAERMIVVLNPQNIQVWGTNEQHEELGVFLELIWGSDIHCLLGDTRAEVDEMINGAMWRLIEYLSGEYSPVGYLNGGDIGPYFPSD